ncbi:MAG: putative bifunctional diguanylate cyclase/phosphodiesterase [Microcoleaceae cyanobacterium]
MVLEIFLGFEVVSHLEISSKEFFFQDREPVPENQQNLDLVTGLPSRVQFMHHLASTVEQIHHHDSQRFALLLLDIDRFQLINNSLGYQAGDQLLAAIAQRLGQYVRPTDSVTRLSGDKFAVLLSNIPDLTIVAQIAKRIQQQLKQPLNLKGHEVSITVSMGINLSHKRYQHAEDLLRDADIALNRARSRGKDCCAVFNQTMHSLVLEKLHIENDLRRAIETHQLQLHYQPIVSIKTSKIAGFEALLRWQHPERGTISPALFVPVAEETGLIHTLGKWVLTMACQQIQSWNEAFPQLAPLFMSVNLSSQQLTRFNLVEEVAQVLQKTGCDPRYLKLEITENAINEKSNTVVSTLEYLQNMGIHLCIDDFGTGYSSLSRLYDLPIDTLKIDRSFVSGMTSIGGTAKIAAAIIALAESLEMEIIAEGVEAEQQLNTLQSWGCQYAQGFWFARPEAAHLTEIFLTSQAHLVSTH